MVVVGDSKNTIMKLSNAWFLFSGDKWKGMTAQDRQPFINKAEELRIQHMQTYPDYKYRPRRRPKNKHAKVKGGQNAGLYASNRLSPSCASPPGSGLSLTPPSTPTKVSPLDISRIKTEDMGPCSAQSAYGSASYQGYTDCDDTPTQYNSSFVFPPPQYKTGYYSSCYYSDMAATSEGYYPSRPSSTPLSPCYTQASNSPPMPHRQLSTQTSVCGASHDANRAGEPAQGQGQQQSFIQQLIGYDDYKDIQPDEFDQYLTEQANPTSTAVVVNSSNPLSSPLQ